MNKEIFHSEISNEDIRAIKEDYPDYNEDEILNIAYGIKEDEISSLRDLANEKLYNNEIIAIADLGLWDGRHTGYSLINNPEEIFDSYDSSIYYIDGHKNLRSIHIHHDGRNYILYRIWKENLSEKQKENFLEKIYTNKLTKQHISVYTKSIGKYFEGEE